MKIQVDEITSVIKQEIAQYSEQLEASEIGRVIAVGDGVTQIYGLANAMADHGVGGGDRVAIMQVNTPQCIELYFATAQLDAIYVPINFRA